MNEQQAYGNTMQNANVTQTVKRDADVYNVLILYYLELVETEGKLFTASSYGVPASKVLGERYITIFYKLFMLTWSQLSPDLVSDIRSYFEARRRLVTDTAAGIPLSQRLRLELEEKGVIVLFNTSLLPPFVSPERMLDAGEI